MKDFLKRNAFIVLGVSLPVVLVGFLLLVQAISRIGQEPPAYPVAFLASNQYSPLYWIRTEVGDNGQLALYLEKPEHASSFRHGHPLRVVIAIYDAADDRLETFDLEMPAVGDGSERVEIPLPDALAGHRFDDSATAPDGYRFDGGDGTGGGLFTELLGVGSRHGPRLIRDGVGFRIPDDGMIFNQRTLIGWVTDEQ